MHLPIKSLLIILLAFNASCKNQPKESDLTISEQPDTIKQEIQNTKMETTKVDTVQVIGQLQGKWKESEYPYRKAEFVNATVKFVEEGTEGTPKFEKYTISQNCPFENNNIRDLQSSDVILVMPETKRCEKLKVSNDTLILSGFSTNTNADYSILHLRSK